MVTFRQLQFLAYVTLPPGGRTHELLPMVTWGLINLLAIKQKSRIDTYFINKKTSPTPTLFKYLEPCSHTKTLDKIHSGD